MKLLTKEEERAHYHATLQGGILGGLAGIGVGVLGVYAGSRRYHFVNSLTLPLKAFLVTSAGTFSGIVAADHSSRAYESARNPLDREYREREAQRAQAEVAGKSWTERAMAFGKAERYKIVGASWLLSMGTAWHLVNRDKLLSGAQKLVQARVYAQFLTLGVLVATAAFEISDQRNQQGRYETVKYIDPHDPDHKRMLEKQEYVEPSEPHSDGDDMWKDMVASEEERLREHDEQKKKLHHDKGNGKSKTSQHKADAKTASEGKGDGGVAESDKKHENDAEGKAKGEDAKVNKTGQGEDGKANTGGTGEATGNDPGEKRKPVKGANEAKNRDGKPAKGG